MYYTIDPATLAKKDVLEEIESDRRWHVKGKHPFWSQGWIIRSGATTRIIFPEDMVEYNLYAED